MSDLFHMSVSSGNLIIRAVVVYGAVLFLLRISGKRQLGQMSAIELVTVLLISNAVQNSMNAGDNSLVGGLLSAVILIVLSWSISMLTYRSKAARFVFEGRATLLVHNGKAIIKNLEHERLSIEELRSLLRRQGIHHLDDIHTAILESDATLTVTKKTDLKIEPHTKSDPVSLT